MINRYDSQKYAQNEYIRMQSRSRILVRSKEELKKQLLMGFRKKNKQDTVDLHRSQEPIHVQYSPHSPQLPNYSVHYSPHQYSILNQFSKCPIREDQGYGCGEQFLNKFMFTKSRVAFPAVPKNSVSVQTELPTHPPIIAPTSIKQAPTQPKTPDKVQINQFNMQTKQKQNKSIIDVSGNLSNMKYPISDNKNIENRILSESIIENNSSRQSSDSAKDLLKHLESIKDQSDGKDQRVGEKGEKKEEKKEPLIKKIQLFKKNKSQPGKQEEVKENTDKNSDAKSEDQENNEKLQKFLSKKSQLKNLIVKKNKEQSSKPSQTSKPKTSETSQQISKWNKPIKKTSSSQISQRAQNSKKYIEQQQQFDPLDLLPPYETSSSGLQAVIEQQNESEMQQSVKYKSKPEDFSSPSDIVKKIFQMHNLQKKKPSLTTNNEKMNVAQSNEIKNRREEVKVEKKDSKGIKVIKNEQLEQDSDQNLKEISLSDLNDVSQIEKTSQNKKIPESYTKINPLQSPHLDDAQLPDYQDSQQQKGHSRQMQKYIVNDISNDINKLKQKMSKQSAFNWQDLQEFKPKLDDNSKQKRESSKGSEGPDKKKISMLDFFDEVHDKLDFGDLSKDINSLRDKMANDSQ